VPGPPGAFPPGGDGETPLGGPTEVELSPARSESSAVFAFHAGSRVALSPAHSTSSGTLAVFIPGQGGKVHPPTGLLVKIDSTRLGVVVNDRTGLLVRADSTRLSVKADRTRLVLTNYG
jgi:hypothetical protein